MRAVDTNVLVRLITGDDEKQTSAAEHFVRSGAWVSQLVLMETSWVLSSVYAFDPRRLAKAIAMLLDQDQLSIEKPAVVAEALALFQANSRIGFSDCLILEAARAAGHTPLGTFDRPLGRLPGAQRV